MSPPPGFAPPAGLQATPGILAMYRQWGPAYPWLVVALGMLGSFATLLASTIVNVAIPDIMGALGITLDDAQWLSTGFLAASTVTMLVAAWSVRAIGMANTYILAMVVFAAGSILGGLAPSQDVVFVARVVQGVSSGLMGPLAMIVIAQVFPLDQRGKAMGIMSVGTVLAPALGPTLGGWLTDNIGWRWVFHFIVPFALATVPAAAVLLPQREGSGPRPPFDWTGAALAAVWVTCLLVGLSQGQREGWQDDSVLLYLLGAALAFGTWVAWELHCDDPMLELRIFRHPAFIAAAVVTFSLGMGLYGSTYLYPLFLQFVVGMLPLDSGVLMAPAGLVMAALFPVCGTLADRTSHRALVLTGITLFVLSALPMAFADRNTPILDMAWWFVIGRIGLACIFPALTAASLRPLDLAELPHGSGATNFLRQFGGALGVNLISVTMTERMAAHRDQLNSGVTWGNESVFEFLRQAQEELLRTGVPAYQAYEASIGMLLASVGREAAMLGYRDGFLLVCLIMVASLPPAWFIGRRRAPGRDSRLNAA